MPGRDALVRYYNATRIAKAERMASSGGPTWRASADWGAKLGYSADDIAAANRHSLQLMHDLRARHETAASPMVVSGCSARAATATIPARSWPRWPPRIITACRSKRFPTPAPTW